MSDGDDADDDDEVRIEGWFETPQPNEDNVPADLTDQASAAHPPSTTQGSKRQSPHLSSVSENEDSFERPAKRIETDMSLQAEASGSQCPSEMSSQADYSESSGRK